MQIQTPRNLGLGHPQPGDNFCIPDSGSIYLACIDHKFWWEPWGWRNLCDQFRLWQQNSRLAPEILLLFGEKSLKTVCYHLCIFKLALKWTRSVCLRAR
jgi:hypothetical protein